MKSGVGRSDSPKCTLRTPSIPNATSAMRRMSEGATPERPGASGTDGAASGLSGMASSGCRGLRGGLQSVFRAFVEDALGLALAAGDQLGLHQVDGDAEADHALDVAGHPAGDLGAR